MDNKKQKESKLLLIPKVEQYIEYVIGMIIKLPRVEKFSIGTEYKTSVYQILKNVMLLNKINKQETKETLNILNNIDADLSAQRIYLRIMKKARWIDEKKFKTAMEQIYEIGKLIGGLIKYYAKNNKE